MRRDGHARDGIANPLDPAQTVHQSSRGGSSCLALPCLPQADYEHALLGNPSMRSPGVTS